MSTFCREFLVPQRLSVEQANDRVAEQVRILSVVEPELQLVNVGIEMLGAHLMERTDDRTVKERPHTFDPVCVNVAADVLLGSVVDGFVSRVLVCDPVVSLEFVGVDGLSFIGDNGANEPVEGGTVGTLSDLQNDVAARSLAPTTIVLFPM